MKVIGRSLIVIVSILWILFACTVVTPVLIFILTGYSYFDLLGYLIDKIEEIFDL